MTGNSSTQDPFCGNLAKAALAYAEAGLPVFPLHERSKRPMTPRGYLDATCDRATIEQYWQICPSANIGLAVPPGWVVVDIDRVATSSRLRRSIRPALAIGGKYRSPRHGR